jgi:hypothetical protein
MTRLILLRILESYFRHRWLHLIPVALFAVAAVVYLAVLWKPQYVSYGVLYVQGESLLSTLNSVRGGGFSWITPAQATAEEIVELLHTDAFVRAAIARTPLEEGMKSGAQEERETIAGAREAIWTIQQGKNQVLVGASHEDGEIAYELVQAVFEVYVQWKINSDIQQGLTAHSFYDEVAGDYKVALDDARADLLAYLEEHPGPLRGERSAVEQVQINRLQAEVDLAASRYGSALEKREAALLAQSQTEGDVRQSYYVLDAPRLPSEPEISKRKIAQNFLVFLGAGLVLSIISIVGSALMDRSCRFPLDAQMGLGLPVLGVVPPAAKKSDEVTDKGSWITEASKIEDGRDSEDLVPVILSLHR